MGNMPKREVTVGNHTYEFYLIDGQKAFKASRKIMSKAGSLLTSYQTKNSESINQQINDLIMDDFDMLLDTFIDKNNLRCDGTLITDFGEHFAGRFTDIPKLLYKVILENDKDFFHFLTTLLEKTIHNLAEKVQANSLKNQEMEETMQTMVKSLKENLG